VLSVGPGARQFSPSQDLPVGESPPVGNLDYRHRPGYRLEVKTAGSAVSGSGRVAQLCLVVREFLFFGMEWPGKLAIWKCSGCRKESGRAREVLRGWRALFASREAEARYRCREYSRTEEDVGKSSKSPEGQQPLDHAGKRRRDISASQTCALQRDDYDCRERWLWLILRTVRRLRGRPGYPRSTATPCANWGRPEPIKRIRISVNITRA
jgi:hypothetical protein